MHHCSSTLEGTLAIDTGRKRRSSHVLPQRMNFDSMRTWHGQNKTLVKPSCMILRMNKIGGAWLI
jgi:hypothetical protein